MKLVDVSEEDDYYLVRVEDPYQAGKYHRVAIRKTDTIKKMVENGIKDLEWRSEGKEFPTS